MARNVSASPLNINILLLEALPSVISALPSIPSTTMLAFSIASYIPFQLLLSFDQLNCGL